jgi:outer membrane receptor protein involved in Fe transport
MRGWAIGIVLVGLSGLVSTLEAQGAAALSGTVVDDLNSVPLVNAMVSIPKLGLQAVTGADGQFLLEGIPGGAHEVKFESHGYVGVVERIMLTDAAFLQIRLDPLAAVLDQIMVIAGRTPTTTTQVRNVRTPDSQRSFQSVLDLLEGQVPGVVVRRGGGVANGVAIFIRGVNSFRSDGAPLIIVDGVRLDNTQTGQNSIHTLDLIPAEVVSSIRIIKGAAEASAYSNGANGVVLIETMRGEAQR